MTRRRSAHGFTIIELLTVISIIILLIGILLPTLGAIRKVARISVCQNNAGVIASAAHRFTEDNNGFYPGPEFRNVKVQEMNLIGEDGDNGSYGGNTDSEDRALQQYLEGNIAATRCPLDEGSSKINKPLYEAFGTSYWQYAKEHDITKSTRYAQGGTWILTGQPISRVQMPSKKMIIADAVISLDLFPTIKGGKDEWHEGADPAGISMGFADTHAEQRKRKTGTAANPGSPQGMNPDQLQNKIDQWVEGDPDVNGDEYY